jgi:hypothetical protein
VSSRSFSIDVSRRLGAVGDIVKDEVQEEIAKAILESSVDLLGAGAETLLPFIKVARIGWNLREKLRAIEERHRRGEDDEMMDLADNLEADDALFNDVSKDMKKLSNALADGSALDT